jgi:hypothetical protein
MCAEAILTCLPGPVIPGSTLASATAVALQCPGHARIANALLIRTNILEGALVAPLTTLATLARFTRQSAHSARHAELFGTATLAVPRVILW